LARIRINKLAVELNVQNDQIIDALQKKNVTVKNFMSSIDEEATAYIRELFSPKGAKKPAATTAKPKAKAKSKAKAKANVKFQSPARKRVEPEPEPEEKPAPPPEVKEQKVQKGPKESANKPVKEKSSGGVSELTTLESLRKAAPKITTLKRNVNKALPKPIKLELDEPQKPVKKTSLKIIKTEDKPHFETKKLVHQKSKPKPVHVEQSKTQKRKKAKAIIEEPKIVEPVGDAQQETFEVVQLTDNIPVRDLAEKLKCTANNIIKELMLFGIMSNINQCLDFDLACKVADKLGFEVERVQKASDLDFEEDEQDLEADRTLRPAIVTIMGHVDHGKTSLLDAIHKTNVTQGEAGGITQHIGAYQVQLKHSAITFLDTPGHEAFTAMRARGAQVTDIVVLVVAADDGIKPQTKEAIDHANAAGVPIMVAINKIDKPDANPAEVKKQLANLGLLPEEWGGQTIYSEISALVGTGIEHLLEVITLQAEIMELKANNHIRAKGTVIESKLDRGRGPVATVIVQQGVLSVGDPFIVGPYFGKVRSLINDKGHKLKKAGPSTPVEVIGIPSVPNPGEQFIVVNDEKKARQFSLMRIQEKRESHLAESTRVTMDDLHQQISEGKIQQLNLIIKADVQGSIHAIEESFTKLESELIKIKTIHAGVGGITESDVLLASASNAIIIGFSVRPTDKASQLAAREEVDIRLYSIIYEAINDMKLAMDGMLEPKFKEVILGKVEVREVFTVPKVGTIAGCKVASGKVEKNVQARLIRDNVVVYDGKILSLRRFKDDVKEVQSGYECGLCLDKFQDLKQGDIVEPYMLEEITR